MPKFNYRQEAKIITWETAEFSIDADTQEEADRIASSMTDYDIAESDYLTLGNTSYDCNSIQLIVPEQNGGAPTLKVFRDDDDMPLVTNAE